MDKNSKKNRAKRVVCAQDMGQLVNPHGATIQMEGCITMGVGYALAEEVRFENGRLLDTSFDIYPIPRFSWLPKNETVLMPNSSLPPREVVSPRSSAWGAFWPRRFTIRPVLKCYSFPYPLPVSNKP